MKDRGLILCSVSNLFLDQRTPCPATNWFFGARSPEWSRVLQVSHHRPPGIWPLS